MSERIPGSTKKASLSRYRWTPSLSRGSIGGTTEETATSTKIGRVHLLPAQQLVEPHPDLVGGAFGVGRQPPMGAQFVALEETDHGVGVPHVQREQKVLHIRLREQPRYNYARRLSRFHRPSETPERPRP